MTVAQGNRDNQGAWSRRLLREFQRARRESGGGDLTIELAGLEVRLAFAQPALEALAQRLMGHLELAPGRFPDLQVYCWQGENTAERILTGSKSQSTQKLHPQTRLRCNRNGRIWERQLARGTEMLLDPAQQWGLYRMSPGPGIAFPEQASLLHPLLVSWAAQRGLIPAHAAAVGSVGKGVLLAGAGGSGKTTTALQCLLHGMDFAGDDRVVIQVDPPRVWSIYGSAKIDGETLDLLPELAAHVRFEASAPREKGLFYLNPLWRERITRDFSLHAIILPQVREPWSGRLVRVEAAEALRTLAPSTLLAYSRDEAAMFGKMAQLVRRIPAYRLGLGGAKAADGAAIQRMLQEVL